MRHLLERVVRFPSLVEPYIGCTVLVLVFVSALLGRLIRRKLPGSHLDAQTEAVVKLSMGVVGTLAALTLGLLVATANSSFTASSQEVTSIAANLIQLVPPVAPIWVGGGRSTRSAAPLSGNEAPRPVS